MRRLLAFVTTAVLAASLLPLTAFASGPYSLPELEQCALTAAASYRAANGLGPLTVDNSFRPKVRQAAARFAASGNYTISDSETVISYEAKVWAQYSHPSLLPSAADICAMLKNTVQPYTSDDSGSARLVTAGAAYNAERIMVAVVLVVRVVPVVIEETTTTTKPKPTTTTTTPVTTTSKPKSTTTSKPKSTTTSKPKPTTTASDPVPTEPAQPEAPTESAEEVEPTPVDTSPVIRTEPCFLRCLLAHGTPWSLLRIWVFEVSNDAAFAQAVRTVEPYPGSGCRPGPVGLRGVWVAC